MCYRHATREAHIRCQRCNRPICPDCMRPAAVGFQCPTCVNEGARQTRQGQTAYGGARSDNPARTSQILIALNAAVWVAILATGGSGSTLVYRLALLPQQAVAPDGNGGRIVVPGVADGSYWQLLTSMFTHVEVLHIGFNMVALWFLGPQLESVLGRVRFLTVYLLSGLAGSVLVYWLAAPNSLTLGASGAVFGLMGALLVVALKVGANVSQLLLWIGVNFVITVVGRDFISWQGHLGGFVAGVLLALLIVYAPRARRLAWQWAGIGSLAFLGLVLVLLRTVVLTT